MIPPFDLGYMNIQWGPVHEGWQPATKWDDPPTILMSSTAAVA